jgi:hypothetical protein
MNAERGTMNEDQLVFHSSFRVSRSSFAFSSSARLRPALARAAPFLLGALLWSHSSPARGRQARQTPPENSLKLTAEVVKLSSCAGSSGVDFLHVRVRLRYRNAGASKLIVYRGGNLFFQVLVGADDGGSQAGTLYELKTTSARYATREPEKVDAPAPNRDFALLRPGASFETEVSVTLPVTRAGAPRAVGAIAPGRHVLRLSVSTWYESREMGERLRERWRRHGYLWTAPVGAAPVGFETDGPRPARGCPGEAARAASPERVRVLTCAGFWRTYRPFRYPIISRLNATPRG